MKKLLVSFMTLVLTASASWAQAVGTETVTKDKISIRGVSYDLTRTTKQIASGVKYITLEIPGKKATSNYVKGAKCYVIEADLTDPTVSVRHGDDYRDSQHTLSTMATTLSNDKSKVVGGVNANFWITVEKPYATKMKGEPFGVSIKDGVMFSDLNTNTAKHCGGPTKTGAMVIDGNGKCYIDWLKSQKTNNASGSGWNFNVVNPSVSSTPIALDQVNGVSCPKVASVYIKSAYGASKGFRQVTSSSDYSTATGTSNTIVYLNFAGGDTKWNSGKQDLVIKKIEREVVVNGKTLGEYDVALVFRWEDMQSRVASWKVGQTVTITTCVNFKSQGTATSIRQAVSGNSVTMANGEIGYIEQANYNGKIYPRTIYATNTAGTKLWLIVIEHYPNRQYTYGGMTTTDATYVAKYMGATWAMQVDCGGSSQMYADGKQVSQSYDTGGVRAVQSGVFILSTPSASGGVTPPTTEPDPETPPTTSANIKASVTSVSLSAANPSVNVTITAQNLTSDLTVKSATGSVTVTTTTGWDARTGGTLTFALNKSATPGTYQSYVALQSGTNRLEIPVEAVVTAEDNTDPPVTEPEPEPEPPVTSTNIQANVASVNLSTATPSVNVIITAQNLKSDINFKSATGAVLVDTVAGWNALTGGTLMFKLNKSFSPGTYENYVAVQSGTNRLEIPVKAVVTEADNATPPAEDTTTPDVENPEEETPATPAGPLTANPSSITLTGEKGVYPASYIDVTITGTGLAKTIKYNSNTSAVVVSPEGWNEMTGGVLRLTLNPDFSEGIGTHKSHVAVRSGNDSVFIYTTVIIKEPGSGTTNPSEPDPPTEPETPTEVPDYSADPVLTKVWDTNNVLITENGRYGVGYKGKVYAADVENKKLYSWNAQGANQTEVAQKIGGGYAILSDGAGHLLISKDGLGKSPTDWQIYDISTNTATDLTLTMPTGVTLGTYCYVHDNVDLAGNLASDATIFIAPRAQAKVAKIMLKNGVQTAATVVATASDNFSNDFNLAVRDVAYSAIGNESFLWRKRGGDLNYFSNGAAKTIAVPSTKVNNTGLAIFTLNNIEYAVIATGLYKADGFSIFNLATGEVVATRPNSITTEVDQYSSFNVEKVSESAVNIYFYKSGISCGQYKFAYPMITSGGTTTQLDNNTQTTFACFVANNTLHVEGLVAEQIALYTITGQKVAEVRKSNTMSLQLQAGVYVAKVMDKEGVTHTEKIFVK